MDFTEWSTLFTWKDHILIAIRVADQNADNGTYGVAPTMRLAVSIARKRVSIRNTVFVG